MSFFALDEDVQWIIAKHLINGMSVKGNILTKTDDDLQKIFFGEIIIDIEFQKNQGYWDVL